MNTKNAFFKRAERYFSALFFTFGSIIAFAGPPKVETSSDIIEKAYTLSQQKERQQAILVLANAIKKEGKKNPKATKELSRALEQISNVFYQDKSQQLYELGLSFKLTDPQLAIQKMNEAIKIEPDNLAIQVSQARLMIELNDCSGAFSLAKKIKEINPFSEEVDLVTSQASVCLGQFESYQALRPVADEKKSALALHWGVTDLEYEFKAGNFAKTISLSKSLQVLDPNFPESYFWEWKVRLESKLKAEDPASKYVSLCKGLSPRSQRAYVAEPFLCRRTAEVETFLKKNNTTSP